MRSLKICLPVCSVTKCAIHKKKEWPILERIYNHLGTAKLKDMMIRFLECDSGPLSDALWIDRFAKEKSKQGTNILIVDSDGFVHKLWAGTSDINLLNFIKRNASGDNISSGENIFKLMGLPGNLLSNVLEVLSNVIFLVLGTDSNFKLDALDRLKRCSSLVLLNTEPIEEDEVLAMNAILARLPQPNYHTQFPNGEDKMVSVV